MCIRDRSYLCRWMLLRSTWPVTGGLSFRLNDSRSGCGRWVSRRRAGAADAARGGPGVFGPAPRRESVVSFSSGSGSDGSRLDLDNGGVYFNIDIHNVDDIDRLASALGAELDRARGQREQGVILPAADALTRVELGAPLADQDLAGADDLAAGLDDRVHRGRAFRPVVVPGSPGVGLLLSFSVRLLLGAPAVPGRRHSPVPPSGPPSGVRRSVSAGIRTGPRRTPLSRRSPSVRHEPNQGNAKRAAQQRAERPRYAPPGGGSKLPFR